MTMYMLYRSSFKVFAQMAALYLKLCHLKAKNVVIHCFKVERRERDKGMKG
jgi:hypothetical protein